jgi:hypothetical protein
MFAFGAGIKVLDWARTSFLSFFFVGLRVNGMRESAQESKHLPFREYFPVPALGNESFGVQPGKKRYNVFPSPIAKSDPKKLFFSVFLFRGEYLQ